MKNIKQRIIEKKLKEELSIKNGIVKVDEVSCDGCGDCIEKCPFNALSMITFTDKEVKALPFKGRLKVMVKGSNKAIIIQDLCTACGICMKVCHEFAIHKTAKKTA